MYKERLSQLSYIANETFANIKSKPQKFARNLVLSGSLIAAGCTTPNTETAAGTVGPSRTGVLGQPDSSASPRPSPTTDVRPTLSPNPSPTKTPEATQVAGSAKGGPGATESPAPVVGKAPTPDGKSGPGPTVVVPGGEICPPVDTALQTNIELGGTGIRMAGVPSRASNVDVARGQFRNTVGLGTEAFAADPGGLGVGPDFESRFSGNPWGDNPAGWRSMWESGGAIFPWLDEYLHLARECPPKFQNLPEGGFVWLTGVQMTVDVGKQDGRSRWQPEGIKIELPEQQSHDNIYFFMIRGLYGDNAQNTDKNRTLLVTDYVPGHTLLKMYPSRRDTNTAFISEGQVLQDLAVAHSTGTNCGDGGCSKVTVVYLDVNTGAAGVWEHTATRDQAKNFNNMRSGWSLKYSNYR